MYTEIKLTYDIPTAKVVIHDIEMSLIWDVSKDKDYNPLIRIDRMPIVDNLHELMRHNIAIEECIRLSVMSAQEAYEYLHSVVIISEGVQQDNDEYDCEFLN